ncbi:MAG: SAM-dependent chlorinase/fluorinase [Cyclobacteriaceae bacterium]
MALVTLLSDFGTEDHYVAAVKAAILAKDQSLNILDISHHIRPSDIGHAAYVLGSVFRDFPERTVHLCAIGSNTKESNKLIGVELEGHFFVGFDCGLFSLLSKKQPTSLYELNQIGQEKSTFKSKDVLAGAAAQLAQGVPLSDLGVAIDQIQSLIGRQLKATKKEIVGTVIRVDYYGNLITNILKSEFDTIRTINGGTPFMVSFGREKVTEIHQDFYDVDSGECAVFFNSNGRLQIGINKGNASELLGLPLDAHVIIHFYQ